MSYLICQTTKKIKELEQCYEDIWRSNSDEGFKEQAKEGRNNFLLMRFLCKLHECN